MEGLLIAEELAKLPALPSARGSWRFPDAHTFVLPLGPGALWLWTRPPQPRLAYRAEAPGAAGSHTGFQGLLAARAVGELLGAEQHKLDRVLRLSFGPGEGFVPTPPVTLVAELTGRNANLILLDGAGVILGAARDITEGRNRYRQVRAGLPYAPPPPYDKLDPRTAGDAELRAALLGQPASKLREVLDGIGPELGAALLEDAGLSAKKVIGEAELGRLLTALRRLVAAPSAALEGRPNLDDLRRQEARAEAEARVRSALEKDVALQRRRLTDIARVREAAAEAETLRRQADVLLAYGHTVPKNAQRATLTDFGGQPLELPLDPKLTPQQNAAAMYERARKREARLAQAETREGEVREKLEAATALLERLSDLSETELTSLVGKYAPQEDSEARSEPGIRYRGPLGYTVLVGRNARDNDALTFKVARSRDLWLHVQGYTGSHVIVRAGNKDVPLEVILYAAQLAAAYSKAGQSSNVPVDYTLRKHVWKPKGAAPGAVHYTQQKTVYVTPSRRPDAE